MTGSATAPLRAGRQADRPVKAAGTKPTRGNRLPVDRLLPGELIAELRRIAAAEQKITPMLVAKLDRRYHIAEGYGISKRRLSNYLERLRPGSEGEVSLDSKSNGRADGTNDGWGEKICAHHRRQASVGMILDQTFGRLAKCSPDLWERRAYLMLVGLVYERLATNEDEISTEELVILAKVLAENRRVEARLKDTRLPPEATGPATPRTGALPDNLAAVVRQVYGTNLQLGEGEDRARD